MLLRHAKTIPATGRNDHERALVERGRRDAAAIGAFVAQAGLIPDLVIFSGAARASETAAIVVKCWPREVATRAEPGLYDATRFAIHAIVRALPDDAPSVMLVGHNPGVADLANHLVGHGAKSDVQRMAGKFPTSGLAILEFDVDRWRDVAPGEARLTRFATPDDLGVKSA
ncbi:MAG: histidine phosphatase family protein [Roseiarcus sp.]